MCQWVQLFDYSGGASAHRQALCKEVLRVLAEHRAQCRHWKTLLDCSFSIAEQLLRTHHTAKGLESIVEPTAEYLLNTLQAAYYKTPVEWAKFSRILQKWARHSKSIVTVWKEIMKTLSREVKELQFKQGPALELWLSFLHILGPPLKFSEMVQLQLATALHELSTLLVEPPHLAASGNLLLKFFLLPLSKLVRSGKAQMTQIIAMRSLFELATRTKSAERLHSCCVAHLCFLVHSCARIPYFHKTILDCVSALLEYPAAHCLLPSVLQISCQLPCDSLKFAFSIMSYANYYRTLRLEDFEGPASDYLALKKGVRAVLLTCSQDSNLVVSALYGLTTHIIEEVRCGQWDSTEVLEDVLLEKCIDAHGPTASTALHCLKTLNQFIPGHGQHILEFLTAKGLSQLNAFPPATVKAMFNCVQQWLVSGSPGEASELLKCAALMRHYPPLQDELENFTCFLALYLSNFPVKQQDSGTVQTSLDDKEFTQADHRLFALGKTSILSVPVNCPEAKLVVRNLYGKFTLASNSFKVFEPAGLQEVYSQTKELLLSTASPTPQHPETPLLCCGDSIKLLLDHLETEYADITLHVALREPDNCILTHMRTAEDSERGISNTRNKVGKESAEFNEARFLLAHTGILDQLVPLQPGESLERAVNLLDSEPPRDSLKIGVTYVKAAQQSETEILQNSSGTREFQEFVKSLGRTIDIRSHLGNLGGLDCEGSNGSFTISYSDWEKDVAFHVVPLMPTVPGDSQQLLKKRHLGNDIVNIVWSDGYGDYRKDTILTNSNSIIIVIYPLESRLFRIQIYKKQDIEFGPLQDGMVLPREILSALVRETAIQATIQVRSLQHVKYERKPQLRKCLIREIIERFAEKETNQTAVYASII